MITWAFGSVPKDSGTFTFYRTLRPKLLTRGIDLRCVSVGRQEAALWDYRFADDGCVLLAADISNRKKQSQAFSKWCESERIDVVMAVNSVAILSSLLHLPADVRILSRCANAFDHGYRITMSGYQRLNRIVALAPRQIDDLTEKYGAERERIVLIPNGTNTERFSGAVSRPRGQSSSVTLGFLGRLEHNQKGVLYIPPIVQQLREQGLQFKLRIAGKGVHKDALARELAETSDADSCEFTGVLSPAEIPEFLGGIDILLFPSQFEGSPNALLEAMMAGCVPVAWNLNGITDFVIRNGETGYLSPKGDTVDMAKKIAELTLDRDHLRQLSLNVSADARKRFSEQRVADDYADLIHQVVAEPVRKWNPLDWRVYRVDRAFYQPVWRRMLPNSIKRFGRGLLYKLGVSNRNG